MDPLEALQVLEHQKVDLLLSDIRMPIMDGFELVGRAKQLQPEISVLVMTGYGSVEYAIQALHRGVEGLILKPFESSAELVQAVQRVLEESRQRRDAARLQALRPLFDVTERLLAETSPHRLETLILSAIAGIFQALHAGIYRLNAGDPTPERIRTTGNNPLVFDQIVGVPALVERLAEGAAVLINSTGTERARRRAAHAERSRD
jgi:response regulator RpfG family c-di-GMP phosphodiesterase